MRRTIAAHRKYLHAAGIVNVRELATFVHAVRALRKKMVALKKAHDDVYAFAAVHGYHYKGENYGTDARYVDYSLARLTGTASAEKPNHSPQKE